LPRPHGRRDLKSRHVTAKPDGLGRPWFAGITVALAYSVGVMNPSSDNTM
jgi:hypothetical protein